MESRLRLREHEGRELSRDRGSMVVDAIQGLAPTLKPRIQQVSRSDGVVEVKNFIGSVRMSDGTVLEVEPKVPVDGPWAHAVVQLLREDSRISVTGSQRSRPGSARRDLTAVIAFEYARRLEWALSKDGPLQVFERQDHTSRRLNGQLDIGAYARSAWHDPVLFPVRRDELTVANDFARGLSLVSHAFRRSVADTALSARLRRLESAVIPGHPLPGHLNPSAASRRMPAQWAAYRPAWDIAAAVLRNRSLINDPGHSVGLEVAVEPWPLLETLLERTLDAVERWSSTTLKSVPKKHYPILLSRGVIAGEVEPDGVLKNAAGKVVATFEAKYTRPSTHPKKEHRYQALATAAVLHAPLAVLVYPGPEAPKIYDVQGFNGHPARLATIGLDLYGYERDFGATRRAAAVCRLIATATGQSALDN
ncbi:5-methylcytosine restriction system specificity protein McrC [Nocardia asteroides]|uniref:5-methylcytosine restriction system specificity protein McrC n=1 Tax=Nocardia asteroides TaxID=1824 RepID=UPI0033F6B2D1